MSKRGRAFAAETIWKRLMTTIEDIIHIAVKAHDGQKDMIGDPAIQHVLPIP